VTGQVTFGDLLDVADRHLELAGKIPRRPRSDKELPDFARSLHHLATAIGSYLTSEPAGHEEVPPSHDAALDEAESSWEQAGRQARSAAALAASELKPCTGIRPPRTAATTRGKHIDAAASALIAARDLLHTHTASRQDGFLADRSSWAPILTKPAFHRAVSTEIAVLAGKASAIGTSLLIWPPVEETGTTPTRQALARACQQLQILHVAIRAAHQRAPVRANDRDLTRAVPVAITPARHLPDGKEGVTKLCDGIIIAAERLRHSARQATMRPGNSPDLNVESLRHAAAAAVATSHHCAQLLKALACTPEAFGPVQPTTELDQAAEAAAQARDSWYRISRALDGVTSDMTGHITADTIDTRDLALWTGRLTYANPDWTLGSGPRQPARQARHLTSSPDRARLVLAAVHHASDALQDLAAIHQQQARLARRGRRLVIGRGTHPRRHHPAPPSLTRPVLDASEQAQTANGQAAAATAEVVTLVQAPSRILNLADAARGDRPTTICATSPASEPERHDLPRPPGPIERTLQNLGVTDAEQLRQAVAIDQAGEQLIGDVCLDRQSQTYDSAKPTGTCETPGFELARAGRVFLTGRKPSMMQLGSPEREP
jgi:hypothetical protein